MLLISIGNLDINIYMPLHLAELVKLNTITYFLYHTFIIHMQLHQAEL